MLLIIATSFIFWQSNLVTKAWSFCSVFLFLPVRCSILSMENTHSKFNIMNTLLPCRTLKMKGELLFPSTTKINCFIDTMQPNSWNKPGGKCSEARIK